MEPLAAESNAEPLAKRRVWIFVAAAAGLSMIAIGVWVLGSGESVDSSDAAVGQKSEPVALTPTERVVAAPPSTATDVADAALATPATDATTDASDAEADEDAKSAAPTPTRPPRPITRPRTGTTYEPLGI